MIFGVRPVASLDAARSGPAYQIGSLEESGFKPMFVLPVSLYRARTGRISLDGLTDAKNASFSHIDGSRTVSTFALVRVLRACEVQSVTSMLAAISRGQRPSSPATDGYSEV